MAILNASTHGHGPEARCDPPQNLDGSPARIAVTEHGGRLFVTIKRREQRCFALSPDEGVYLAEQLAIRCQAAAAGETS